MDQGAGASGARDEVVKAALASGSSYQEAARLAGLSVRTVARRMGDPVFAAEVREVSREHFDAVARSLLASAPDAVSVIRDVMNSAVRPADKLKAAVVLLTEARRLHQMLHVDASLREILRLLDAGDDVESAAG